MTIYSICVTKLQLFVSILSDQENNEGGIIFEISVTTKLSLIKNQQND